MPKGAKEDHGRYKLGCNHNSMRNGHSGLNAIKTADPIITPINNSTNYGIPEDSTNVETVPAKENYTAKVSGKEKEDEVESVTREGINCERKIQELNQKFSHVPTRVSTQAKCILPPWTRRCRSVT